MDILPEYQYEHHIRYLLDTLEPRSVGALNTRGLMSQLKAYIQCFFPKRIVNVGLSQ